jgi:hypothetical protein
MAHVAAGLNLRERLSERRQRKFAHGNWLSKDWGVYSHLEVEKRAHAAVRKQCGHFADGRQEGIEL